MIRQAKETEMVAKKVSQSKREQDEERMPLADLLESRWAFGPIFFLRQLAVLVRDRCPDPHEGLPAVRLHLGDGEILDVCHIIGVTPTWLAVAVNESERPSGASPMRTEIVPYGMVARVSIRPAQSAEPHIGFDITRRPDVVPSASELRVMTPEEALAAVARQAPRAARAGEAAQAGDVNNRASQPKRRGM